MRIRTTKPEFWRSQDVANLPWEYRLLFIGLWSYVDDNGVGLDDARLIKADLFPLDDAHDQVLSVIREGLARLSRDSLLARYEVSGRRYVYIPSWDKHQRVDKPGKPRYPRPSQSADQRKHTPRRETPAKVSGDHPACSKEYGVRSKEQLQEPKTRPKSAEPTDPEPPPVEPAEAPTDPTEATAGDPAAPDENFEKFWSAFPRKVKKLSARRAWTAALKRTGVDPIQLIESAQKYADSTNGQDRRFVLHPASWLKSGAYDDEPETHKPVSARDQNVQDWLNLGTNGQSYQPGFPLALPEGRHQ